MNSVKSDVTAIFTVAECYFKLATQKQTIKTNTYGIYKI